MAAVPPTSVRIDPELKREAEEVFADVGLTPTAAITLFYRAVVLADGIPFPITRDTGLLRAASSAHTPSVTSRPRHASPSAPRSFPVDMPSAVPADPWADMMVESGN